MKDYRESINGFEKLNGMDIYAQLCGLLKIIDDSNLCDLYKNVNSFDSEEVAEWLCSHYDIFRIALCRNAVARKTYSITHNEDFHDENTDQREKILAKAIYKIWGPGKRPHRKFGHVIGYEIPLEPTKADLEEDFSRGSECEPYSKCKCERRNRDRIYPRGRIDLVAIRNENLFILELKKDRSEETYLRCLLEAYTYLMSIKRIGDFKKDMKKQSGQRTKIKKIVICPLVFECETCRPYNEYYTRGRYVKTFEEMIKKDDTIGKIDVDFYAFKNEELSSINKEYETLMQSSQK